MKSQLVTCLISICLLGLCLVPSSAISAKPAQDLTVNSLIITGEIDLINQNYIIRGTQPAEIFTILNPDPDILDKTVKSGKKVEVYVRVVSGDNVEILLIDGRDYPKHK